MLAILPEVPRHSPERNVPVGTSPNLSATRTPKLIKEFLCSRVTKTHGEVTPGALLTLWVVCTVPSQNNVPKGTSYQPKCPRGDAPAAAFFNLPW